MFAHPCYDNNKLCDVIAFNLKCHCPYSVTFICHLKKFGRCVVLGTMWAKLLLLLRRCGFVVTSILLLSFFVCRRVFTLFCHFNVVCSLCFMDIVIWTTDDDVDNNNDTVSSVGTFRKPAHRQRPMKDGRRSASKNHRRGILIIMKPDWECITLSFTLINVIIALKNVPFSTANVNLFTSHTD